MEGFKPFGIPMKDIEPEILLYEEYESIRLTDYNGLNHEEAATRMDISRPTFTRIYDRARKTIARAFVEGKAVFIEGGDYQTDQFWYRCDDCQKLNISMESESQCTYCASNNLRILNNSHETTTTINS